MPRPEPQEKQGSLSKLWAVREIDHLFSQLGRYTRFVAYSKWSLVVVALLLTVSLIAWPLLTKDQSGVRVSFVDSKTVKQPATSPVMSNPVFNGQGAEGQQYQLTGKQATQKTPTLVVMDTVKSQMLRTDGKWFYLTADRGEYQQDKKVIDLYGKVTLTTSTGTQFVTEHATIEMADMHIYGKETVTGTGNTGNIVASGFEITDNGNKITFTRGEAPVQVKLDRATRKQ